LKGIRNRERLGGDEVFAFASGKEAKAEEEAKARVSWGRGPSYKQPKAAFCSEPGKTGKKVPIGMASGHNRNISGFRISVS
jgi:hypothetical protein